MAKSKRRVWFKFGRFITGLTIACFFLPFFGVSCKGMDVVTMSGADMVGGCQPGGLLAEAKEEAGTKPDSLGSGSVDVGKVPREPLAIVALALAIGVFAMSWMRTRKAMTASVVMSVACIGALVGLWIKVGGDLKKDISEYAKKEAAGGEIGAQITKDSEVEAGPRMGLYMACLGLMAGAALCGLALKEPEGTELQSDAPVG